MADDLSSAVLSMRIVRESIEQAADALARKDAEIAAMQRTMDMVNTSASFHVRRAEQAEARAERAEARVREAPVCRVVQAACTDENREPVHQIIMYLKPVALVLLDTEETK